MYQCPLLGIIINLCGGLRIFHGISWFSLVDLLSHMELYFNSIGVGWLFCIQHFPRSASFWCMLGVGAEVWMKNFLHWFIEGHKRRPSPSSVTWNLDGLGLLDQWEISECNGTGLEPRVWPLHTQDWGAVTIALQALSLVETAEPVQVRFTLRWRDQRSKRMQDGCKVYMNSSWHQTDHVSQSLGLFSKTTSWK